MLVGSLITSCIRWEFRLETRPAHNTPRTNEIMSPTPRPLCYQPHVMRSFGIFPTLATPNGARAGGLQTLHENENSCKCVPGVVYQCDSVRIQAITLSMCFIAHGVIGGNTHEWNRRGMQWV